ncbi:MAG: leucine-rich repeat domain-containing protein [Rhabdochlamydiaceae bacterium]|nr:leucine-rich repeat domain-containing protein [Rhabdochlamydiaceae bacterium]
MNSASSCTNNDSSNSNLPISSPRITNDLNSLAKENIPIASSDIPRPRRRSRSYSIERPLPTIESQKSSSIEELPPPFPPESTLEDLQANEYTAYFIAPDADYEQITQSIRASPNSEGRSLLLYIVHVSKALIKSCYEKSSQFSEETIFFIIRELLPPLEIQKIAVSRRLAFCTYRKRLVEICQEKLDSLSFFSLVDTLIKYLPLTMIAQAKVEASFFVLFCRFTQHLSPDAIIPGSFMKSSIEDIKGGIQTHDLSLICDLDLSWSYIEVLPLDICSQLVNIKKLNFSNNKCASLSVLHSLQTLSSLEELDLSKNKFTSIPLTFFDHLPCLRKIDLRLNAFSEQEKDKIKEYFTSRDSQTETKILI